MDKTLLEKTLKDLWGEAFSETVLSLVRDSRITPLKVSKIDDFWTTDHLAGAGETSRPLDNAFKSMDAKALLAVPHFVIQHDWNFVLESAKVDGGVDDEVSLPNGLCTFEFQIGKVAVVVTIEDKEEGTPFLSRAIGDLYVAVPFDAAIDAYTKKRLGTWDEGDTLVLNFIRSSPFVAPLRGSRIWNHLGDLAAWEGAKPEHFPEVPVEDVAGIASVGDLVHKQIRAICYMLEAGVAESTRVVIEPKLNKSRVKSGKHPLRDFNIIDLASRHRSSATGSGKYKGVVRLHLRRGHWWPMDPEDPRRHWRKATLVGNPDLGWVEHIYRA